jgi:hypothetical protein
MSLPGAEQPEGRYAAAVMSKGKLKKFVWVWNERVTPKKPRVPNFDVIAVRVANLAEKERLLTARPEMCFTEPHYNGFPAVLVRLKAVRVPELRALITQAWRCQAPKELVRSQAGPINARESRKRSR